MSGLLSIDEALAAGARARAVVLDAERVPVDEAAGRFLAEDVAAAVDLPPFASSAMDGYALRADDTPGPAAGRLPAIAAGLPAERALEAGEAMAISTGGAVPEGADSVVPIEIVVESDNELEVPAPVELGANVRPIGGDVRAGDLLLSAGTRVGAAQIGALAAAGRRGAARRAEAEGRRPQHRDGAACARRAARARGRSTSRTRRCSRRPSRPPVPRSSASARSRTTRVSTGGRSSAASRRTCWSARAASRSARTTSSAGSWPSSESRRTSGASPSGRASRSRSASAGGRSSSGCRATRSRRSSGWSSSCGRRCSRCRARPIRSRPTRSRRLAAPLRRNAARDELARARTRRDADGTVLEPLTGQESHMIARAAGADALVLVPSGEGRLEPGERVRYLPLR